MTRNPLSFSDPEYASENVVRGTGDTQPPDRGLCAPVRARMALFTLPCTRLKPDSKIRANPGFFLQGLARQYQWPATSEWGRPVQPLAGATNREPGRLMRIVRSLDDTG